MLESGSFDLLWHLGIVLHIAIPEEAAGVEPANLRHRLRPHLVAPQAVGFGCLQLGLGNLTTQHRLELTDNQAKEPLCLVTLYLATKVPAALIFAHRAITKHPIGHALLAGFAKDARMHRAGEDVVEAI